MTNGAIRNQSCVRQRSTQFINTAPINWTRFPPKVHGGKQTVPCRVCYLPYRINKLRPLMQRATNMH